MDPVKNFAKVTVSTGYNAAATSIVLETGEGSRLPDPATDGEFNLVWWNNTDYADPADDPNREIVRVTDRSTDTLTVVRPAVGNDYNGEGSENTASTKNEAGKTYKMELAPTKRKMEEIGGSGMNNLLKNGNFLNNSTNGYGGTPDDWTNSSANPVQGGFPSMTKQQLIDLLGVADGDIEGLWNLTEASGDATDLSSNGYDLTDTNTVLSSDDGLMGKARDFTAANSEKLTIAHASSGNLGMTGAQTWFAYVNLESIPSNYIMAKSDSTPTNYIGLNVNANGVAGMNVSGLSPATVGSDIILETGKWYFLVGIYNGTDTLTIWVNGVKKTVSVSGSHTVGTGSFSIGNLGDFAGSYMDGLIQNAGVLSVALTDDQVKKLWAYTTYKGLKIRRATTNGYMYQELNEADLILCRGKEVVLSATVNCESTNHGIYIETDGTGGTTTKANPASADTEERISVSITVPSDATYVRYGSLAETTDGNSWVREMCFSLGSSEKEFYPSYDDVNRIPRLLDMNPPASIDGYRYEEKRCYEIDLSPTGLSSVSNGVANVMVNGCKVNIDFDSAFGGTSNATSFAATLPYIPLKSCSGAAVVWGQDNGSLLSNPCNIEIPTALSPTINLYKTFYNGAWTNTGNKFVWGRLTYNIPE